MSAQIVQKKNTGEKIRYYVCNKDCQREFWNSHREKGHKYFPQSFEAIGTKGENVTTEIERCLIQVQILRDLMPMNIQIDFENADLQDNKDWFRKHWETFRNGMVFHSLNSFGTFDWRNFCQWLEEIAVHDKSAEEAMNLFKNHQAYVE